MKETLTDLQSYVEELDRSEAARVRAIVMWTGYLAQDRVDTQYAAKEVCRDGYAQETELDETEEDCHVLDEVSQTRREVSEGRGHRSKGCY